MAFAPHTNTDVHLQLKAGLIPTPLPLLFGHFRHKETNTLFEYGERRWHDDAIEPTLPHVIYTIDGTRLAKVLKTVADQAAPHLPDRVGPGMRDGILVEMGCSNYSLTPCGVRGTTVQTPADAANDGFVCVLWEGRTEPDFELVDDLEEVID